MTDKLIEIIPHNERERMKEEDYTLNSDLAHYHRFLEGYGEIGVDGIERISKEIAPTFQLYCLWKRRFPGWSYGLITPKRRCWKPEYLAQQPEPNLWIIQQIKKFSRKKRRELKLKNAAVLYL